MVRGSIKINADNVNSVRRATDRHFRETRGMPERCNKLAENKQKTHKYARHIETSMYFR
jgi:hypothetical protein